MNKNIIVITIVIIIITISIVVLSNSSQFKESMIPSIEDNLQPNDYSSINLNNSDSIQVFESTEFLNKNINYTIDKNGNKQFILDVTDTPTLDD